jgi:hypothetical protein
MKTVDNREAIFGRSPAAVGTLFHSNLTRQHCDVRDNSVCVATGHGLDGQGSIPCKVKRFFAIPQCPERLLGPPEPLIQWVSEALSSGVKRLGREGGPYLHLVPRPKLVELYL